MRLLTDLVLETPEGHAFARASADRLAAAPPLRVQQLVDMQGVLDLRVRADADAAARAWVPYVYSGVAVVLRSGSRLIMFVCRYPHNVDTFMCKCLETLYADPGAAAEIQVSLFGAADHHRRPILWRAVLRALEKAVRHAEWAAGAHRVELHHAAVGPFNARAAGAQSGLPVLGVVVDGAGVLRDERAVDFAELCMYAPCMTAVRCACARYSAEGVVAQVQWTASAAARRRNELERRVRALRDDQAARAALGGHGAAAAELECQHTQACRERDDVLERLGQQLAATEQVCEILRATEPSRKTVALALRATYHDMDERQTVGVCVATAGSFRWAEARAAPRATMRRPLVRPTDG